MSEMKRRHSQTQQIVDLLKSRNGAWVGLPEILAMRISQYGARIYQARHEWGLRIENKSEVIEGVRHSWFRLRVDEPRPIPPQKIEDLPNSPTTLFGDMSKDAIGL